MKYYYLIASLPELALEQPFPDIDVNDTLEFIIRNLDEHDQKCSRYLVYPNDNENLTSILLQQYQGLDLPAFKSPSIFKGEDIPELIKKGEDLPDYMAQYLTKYKEKFDLLRPSRIEEYLWISFYEELETLNCDFISDYFRFDRFLRQLSVIHSSEIFKVSLISEYVNDKINRELGLSRPKSILAKSYSYVNKLWNTLETGDPVKIQRRMDKIRWNFIDDYDPMSNFSNNQVFKWILKLMINGHWATLSEEKGKMRFEEICEKVLMDSGISELEYYD